MEIELHGNKLKVFECGKVLVLGKIKPYKDEYYEKKFHLCGKSYKVLQLRFEGKMKMPLVEVQEQGKTKTLGPVSGLFANFPEKTRKNGKTGKQ